METKSNFTSEENLKLISDILINNSKALEKSALRHFLLWGGFITVTALVVGHLWEHFGGPTWNYLWFVSLPVCDVVEHMLFRDEKKLPKGYITNIFRFSERICGVFCFILAIAALLASYMLDPSVSLPIYMALTSFVIIAFGFAASLTGYLMRNKFVVSMGILSGSFGSILAMIVDGSYKMLVVAAVAFITMVLPYFIRRK